MTKQLGAWSLFALAIAVLLTITDYTAHVRNDVLVYSDPNSGGLLPDQPTLAVFGGFVVIAAVCAIAGRLLFGGQTLARPSTPTVLTSLVLFLVLYNLTGVLDGNPMLLYAILMLVWLPHLSLSGLPLNRIVLLSVLLGVSGPVAEGIRASDGFFRYVDVDAFHVPLWLSPLYFNGAVTVGLLSAALAARLRR